MATNAYAVPAYAQDYTLPIQTNFKGPPAIEEADAAYEEVTCPPTTMETSNTKKRLQIFADFPAPIHIRNLMKERIWSRVNKKYVCVVVSLIAALVASICFVAVFVEVATLKSQREISAMQLQQPALQEISTLQAQLNAVQQQQHALQEMVSQFNELTNNLYQMREEDMLLLNQYTGLPSCAALSPSFPSGYYWVRASNGSAVHVYCDMTRSCGRITGGWTRVAQLDTTSNGHQCPSGLTQRTDGDIRTCVRDTSTAGCSSVTFPTQSISYSRVCGRITGYQFGSTDGFFTGHNISSIYLDGVSLTHGNPRQHIWSFAMGLDRTATHQNIRVTNNCPCQHISAKHPPSFVGNNYFCDAANEHYAGIHKFYSLPLWTNASCLCCTNPPWFYKQLPQPTTEDIEMRVCRNQNSDNEDILIQVVEIYVQ